MVQTCTLKSENTPAAMENKLPLTEEESSDATIKVEPITESLPFDCIIPIEISQSPENKGPCQTDGKIFSAPPGVKRYNVKWSNVRRNSDGQRLIFVWPRKTRIRPNCLIYFVPLLRRILIGLMYLGSVHLWPGEFLPTTIPPTAPLPKPPVKCSVIEPLWDDDDKVATRES